MLIKEIGLGGGGVSRSDPFQDMYKWRAFVKKVMNILVPKLWEFNE